MVTFDATTTTDEIMRDIDLTGKVIVVTGASSGLGAEASRVFAKAGASVVMTARNVTKLDGVAATIREEVPLAQLLLVPLDLADLRTVREGAERILEQYSVIDVLLNNAGIMCVPQAYTAQGCEMHFGTNHIGHFLWSCLLIPALKQANGARIVTLSSAAHRYSGVNFDDINYRSRPYDKWQAYGQSKTADILFAVALTKRLNKYGIIANAVHPGVIETELARTMTEEDREALRAGFKAPITWKSIPQGAATEVWAAVSPDLEDISGKYLADCQIAPLAIEPKDPGYFAYAVDEESAEKLWGLSEAIVGQRFAI